jgi:hypothetical protein
VGAETTAARAAAARRRARAGDAAAALAALRGEGPLPEDAAALAEQVRGWREALECIFHDLRDLDAYCLLACELRTLLRARLAAAPLRERGLLAPPLCGTCFNLAAHAWPGWGAENPRPGPYAQAAGMAAARECVAVRLAPLPPPRPRFGVTPEMAHWVLGAHHLARAEFAEARACFRSAAAAAHAAGDPPHLEHGYLALTDLLAAPCAPEPAAAFQAALHAFAPAPGASPDDDAEFFRAQLETARRLFAPAGTP